MFSFNNNKTNIYRNVKNKTKNNINLYNFPYRKKSSYLDNMKFKLKYKDVLFEILSSPKNQKSERKHFNELMKKNSKKENNIWSINSPINTTSKYQSYFGSMPQKNNKKISKIDNINKDHLKRDLFKKYLNIDMKEASNILKNN